jgi:hypothetical protein
VIVKNMNTVWEGGQLNYDQDMDGLSDQLEAQLGSKADKKDSDGNGVSDFVEYKVFGQPCRDSACSPAGANEFQLTLCKAFAYTTNPDGTISYPDSDKDGLNDCEEKLLQSNPNNFSTNGSWVPDYLMLLNGLNLLVPPGEVAQDWDYDGYTNYQEIKGGTPVNIPNTQLPGLQLQSYNLVLTSQTATQECYHLDVTNILSVTPTDTLRVYEMDGNVALDTRRYLRTIDLPMSSYNLTIPLASFPTQ